MGAFVRLSILCAATENICAATDDAKADKRSHLLPRLDKEREKNSQLVKDNEEQFEKIQVLTLFCMSCVTPTHKN